MTITYHPELVQGSEDWHQARCGLLTASEMKLIVTPTFKAAANDKERTHLYELLAQRITGYVEPHYIGDDMLRGHEDEVEARQLYSKNYAKVTEVGFVTNDRFGFTIGYSPDGLVGDDGQLECKSRRQKLQVRALVENVIKGGIDSDHAIQVFTGLLVTERAWCDLATYCGGLPMATVRVFPDRTVMDAILQIAGEFEERLAEKLTAYRELMASKEARLISTERRDYGEIIV